jgi:hypothetical protein
MLLEAEDQNPIQIPIPVFSLIIKHFTALSTSLKLLLVKNRLVSNRRETKRGVSRFETFQYFIKEEVK